MANTMFDIKEELKKLPDSPGVYLMHGENDEIIYVGKAIVLKNRVRQYFQKTNKTAKIQKMVSHITRFEYIITDSELEALILECNLIKEHRPKYNTMLMDDKTYPYIKVTVNEEYPRVLYTRRRIKDKAKYYGPFTNINIVKDSIEILRKIIKIRHCNKVIASSQPAQRPCLYYEIHECDAPCCGFITKEDYNQKIKRMLNFLDGNHQEVTEYVKAKMQEASDNMEFEDAIKYRDLLNGINKLAINQKITTNDIDDRDIIGIAKDDRLAIIQVFFVRDGKLIGREHFHMQNVSENSYSEILSEFIKQFYSGTIYVPREIYMEYEIEDSQIVEKWLSEKREMKVTLKIPKKGDKEKLLELATKNAKLVLIQDSERILKEDKKTLGAVNEIADILGLENVSRMEAFDISNISGFNSVGSMIVFENGKPKRSDYRKFKIKTVIGPNDYASMKEVLTRRFTHGIEEMKKYSTLVESEAVGSFTRFPDLLMMDGGRGQVNIALEVLNELNLDIPVCGMVKDDNHRTRGLYFNNVELPISRNSEGFKLITRIQDEAHRFAIEFHKSLRSKAQVHSILDDINGIGPKRRRILMKYFESVEMLKNASIEELEKLPTFNIEAAKNVYEFFHKPSE